MLACIRLARHFWIVLLTFGLALLLQYVATGIAAAGFAILQPVSVIEEYILLNPDSTAAKSREFAALIGNNGLIGFHQAWSWPGCPGSFWLLAGFFPWIAAPLLIAHFRRQHGVNLLPVVQTPSCERLSDHRIFSWQCTCHGWGTITGSLKQWPGCRTKS
jgi:hypothetical protein